MPVEDAIRWNTRYQHEDQKSWKSEARDWLTSHLDLLPTPGIALDVAMGMGANARVLVERSWKVVGVDIASVAVAKVKQELPELYAVVADLEEIRFPVNSFDLILNFYFLNRDFLKDYARVLKPGGIVFVESLMDGMQAIKPDINREYLLQPDELVEQFFGWEILDQREGWFTNANGHSKAISAIIAQKI